MCAQALHNVESLVPSPTQRQCLGLPDVCLRPTIVPPRCENDALVRTTAGVVSATFGITEFGGSFFWLSVKIVCFLWSWAGVFQGQRTENDGSNTSCCSDSGVVYAHSEKTQAAKQCIMEAQTAMSMEVHQSHVLNGGAKSRRTVISIRCGRKVVRAGGYNFVLPHWELNLGSRPTAAKARGAWNTALGFACSPA